MFGFFSNSGSDKAPAAGATPRPQSLKVEPLEDRLALSTVSVYDGQMHIYGTGGNDTLSVDVYTIGYEPFSWRPIRLVQVTEYSPNPMIQGTVIGSGLESQLPNGIWFRGESGNDWIANNTHLSMQAYGGSGYDTLIGGVGSDYLYGQGDGDVLNGGVGNDWLDGGWYDGVSDYMEGGPGIDWYRRWGTYDAADYWVGFGNDIAWG